MKKRTNNYDFSLIDLATDNKLDFGNRKLRTIQLFAGYGSQDLALKYLGIDYEDYKISEWAIKSIQAYKDLHFEDDNTDYSKSLNKEQIVNYLTEKGISANYNDALTYEQIKRLSEDKLRTIYNNIIASHNLCSITNIKGSDLQIVDTDKYNYLITYSFPCGLAGTKIITKDGYKNIEEVTTSDYVLTHNNRFCKVNKTMTRISDHYYKLKGLGVPELYLTAEHPLYVYRDNKFQWVKVEDLSLSDKFTFNINQNAVDTKYSNEYLWLLGRYVADGHINKYSYNSVNFSINFNKEKEFLDNIPKDMIARFKKFKKAVWDYRIADKDFKEVCLQFKTGAKNKEIPQWIIDLPKEKLQSFFNGYIAGDGHIRKRCNINEIMFSTVSEKLFLGLQQIIAKLYGAICSCSIRHDRRKSTYNDTYNAQFNITNQRIEQQLIGDKIITNIKFIERFDKETPVYNFEVDNDNSYTCQNVIVHNCQDLSLAGLGAGLSENSNTRSSLLWEVKRVLSELAERELPQILLLENVTQLHSKKNMPDFKKWCEFLESLGYTNFWQDLNSKNYGIPQNRNRVFMVSLLNGTYNFPVNKKLTMLMKGLLEQFAPERYYLSGKGVNYVLNEKRKNNNWTNIDADISIPLTAKGQSNWTGSFVSESEYIENGTTNYLSNELPNNYNHNTVNKVGFIEKGSGEHQSNSVYDSCGVSPTLTASDYKSPVKVTEQYNLKRYLCDKLIKENRVNEYDIVQHNYTNKILSGDKNCIDKSGLAITLTTRGDCIGVVVKDKVGNKFLIKDSKQLRETLEQNELKENTCLDLDNRSVKNNVSQTINTGYLNSQRVAVKDIKNNNNYTQLRIRKLLPIECFRLMGVKDKDFYKIAKNQSDSSLYHLAGDSIVCYGLLTSIFAQLFNIDTTDKINTDIEWWKT